MDRVGCACEAAGGGGEADGGVLRVFEYEEARGQHRGRGGPMGLSGVPSDASAPDRTSGR